MATLNACLNFLSAVFLLLGFIFIKQKKVSQHKFCMLAATTTSTLFLICYLYYHYHHGSTKFPYQGWIRSLYLSILLTHTILATVQVPLILMTLRYAFKNELEKHKKLARITWPIWMYVSVTGVVIYFMLYHL